MATHREHRLNLDSCETPAARTMLRRWGSDPQLTRADLNRAQLAFLGLTTIELDLWSDQFGSPVAAIAYYARVGNLPDLSWRDLGQPTVDGGWLEVVGPAVQLKVLVAGLWGEDHDHLVDRATAGMGVRPDLF